MSDGADAVSVLRWGLRRYLLVVVLCVALGALMPLAVGTGGGRYEAEAQVGPERRLLLPNLDPLPRLGVTVFGNGAVADAVRRSVQPQLPQATDVVPQVVELVAPQDNVVFTVVGRGGSAETAAHVANVAARAFALELNKYADSVGSFRVQQLASPPATPAAEAGGPLLTAVGLAAGLVLGVGLVVLLLILRQPVIDLPTAERLSGARGLGRVWAPRGKRHARGLAALYRAVLAEDVDMLLLTGPRNARRDRAWLAGELTEVLRQTRTVFLPRAGREVNRARLRPEPRTEPGSLTLVLGPSELELATRPARSTVILVVREGIPAPVLRRHAEQYGPGFGVVLVKRRMGRPSARVSPSGTYPEESDGEVDGRLSVARRTPV